MLIVFVLILGASAVATEKESCISFGVSLVRLLSAGLTETVPLEIEPYTTTVMVNEDATRAGVILMLPGEAVGVIVADCTNVQDGFLQYVSTKIIPEKETLIRTLYAAWVEERIQNLQDGLIFADTWGTFYCCVMMDGETRACMIADVDYAGDLLKTILTTGK